jgi:hypothetical protein
MSVSQCRHSILQNIPFVVQALCCCFQCFEGMVERSNGAKCGLCECLISECVNKIIMLYVLRNITPWLSFLAF